MKIKVKNVPKRTRDRVCSMHLCRSTCPFYLREQILLPDGDTTPCIVDDYYDPKETIIELPEKYFPTNREWLESLSNKDLAAFYTHGVLIERYSPYPVNLHQIVGNFVASELGIKEWLSQPCRFLMEKETMQESETKQ